MMQVTASLIETGFFSRLFYIIEKRGEL